MKIYGLILHKNASREQPDNNNFLQHASIQSIPTMLLALSCHRWSPKIGPPGPSAVKYVAVDGPPGPSTAGIDGPPGPSVAP